MARKARAFIEGIPYYIFQRGNNSTTCFLEEDDYLRYLERLKVVAAKYKVEIHAYVLLKNEVFFLVTPRVKDGISQLIKVAAAGYSKYFNKKYARTGSLWEARFRSNIVQPGFRILELQKFLELTPIREGFVENPGEYQWSSFVSNAVGGHAKWITPHPAYLALGKFQRCRFQKYRHFVLSRDLLFSAEADRLIQKGKPIAEEQYCVEIKSRFGFDLSPRPAGRPKKHMLVNEVINPYC